MTIFGHWSLGSVGYTTVHCNWVPNYRVRCRNCELSCAHAFAMAGLSMLLMWISVKCRINRSELLLQERVANETRRPQLRAISLEAN